MPKALKKVACEICPTGRFDAGAPFCPQCGHPTTWATHDDRVAWEVDEWRKTHGPAAVAPDPDISVITRVVNAPAPGYPRVVEQENADVLFTVVRRPARSAERPADSGA